MSAILKAAATLARESYMDGVPDEDTLDEWRSIAVAARREYDELKAKLADAIDLAEESVPYADDYFRDKYDLDDRLAKLTGVKSERERKYFKEETEAKEKL